jgi:hypothetical protein
MDRTNKNDAKCPIVPAKIPNNIEITNDQVKYINPEAPLLI